jgi:translation initiation factor 1
MPFRVTAVSSPLGEHHCLARCGAREPPQETTRKSVARAAWTAPRPRRETPAQVNAAERRRAPRTGMTEAEIQNFDAFDAFDDADEKQGDQSKVHIRVQQRNGRKCITTVQGLADDLDVKRICKAFKKNFQCNGAVTKDSEMGEIIQLSGDQRTNVNSFLVDQEICLKSQVVIHGF